MTRQRIQNQLPLSFLIKIFAVISCILFYPLAAAPASADIDAGFLTANVNPRWAAIATAGDLSRPYQSTAEAVITLQALDQPPEPAVTGGRAYLAATPIDSTEHLALRVMAQTRRQPRAGRDQPAPESRRRNRRVCRFRK